MIYIIFNIYHLINKQTMYMYVSRDIMFMVRIEQLFCTDSSQPSYNIEIILQL